LQDLCSYECMHNKTIGDLPFLLFDCFGLVAGSTPDLPFFFALLLSEMLSASPKEAFVLGGDCDMGTVSIDCID